MKFFLIATTVIAVAVASPSRFIVPGPAGPAPIIDLDDAPGVKPVLDSPISVEPAIIDDSIFVEGANYEPPHLGDSPISVEPALIDDSIFVEGANYQPPPPLVQVIVNVNSKPANNLVRPEPSPVIKPEPSPINPDPVIIPEDIVIEMPEIKPTPVIVVEQPEVPEPVIVAPVIVPEELKPEPVIVAPIKPDPVINVPDTLN